MIQCPINQIINLNPLYSHNHMTILNKFTFHLLANSKNLFTYSKECGSKQARYNSNADIIQFMHLFLVPFIILNMAGYFFSMRWVASPPSSRIMFGCQFSAFTHLSMHHQKSSSVSPRHANMEKPEKIMQKKKPLWCNIFQNC